MIRDYANALEDMPEGRDWAVLIRYMDNHAATLRHALHTLQAITSALPEGVDPVRLVKGLAGEPSDAMEQGVYEQLSADLRRSGGYAINPAYIFKAMRAQLYREASE